MPAPCWPLPLMLRLILNSSRYLVVAAVIGALAASLALYVYGLAETVVVIVRAIEKAEISSKGAKWKVPANTSRK